MSTNQEIEKTPKIVMIRRVLIVLLAIVLLVVPAIGGITGNMNAKDASASLPKASPTPSATPSDLPSTGVEETDGTSRQLPLYNGDGETVVFDSTTDPMTPALLDGSLRYQNQTHSWADLVKRVGDDQGYIDGVNSRAAYTGFDWSDVQEFAKVDKTDRDVEARIIQVHNMPDASDADVREEVRTYMGDVADSLHIVHINSNTVNTLNVGSKDNLKMGDYVDGQKMIRVSLTPIIFVNGEATQLDVSKGAGIFIDCANLHWVPKQVYECTDSSCTPPPPVAPPTPECTVNCGPPPVTPPVTPPLDVKKPNEGSGPKGNAPDGSGKNETPGPGPYVPPTEIVQPPAAPYVPPAPPAPKPPAPTAPTPSVPKPAPMPTFDPAPPAVPQPAAPKPSAPETGCIVIPGIEDCS